MSTLIFGSGIVGGKRSAPYSFVWIVCIDGGFVGQPAAKRATQTDGFSGANPNDQ